MSSPPLHSRLGKPGYWETLPQDDHWHIELVPRLSQIAGFEWGSGFYINPLPPMTLHIFCAAQIQISVSE